MTFVSLKILTTYHLSSFLFSSKDCGPGTEDREARQTRAFQRRHSVLQWHCGFYYHLSSEWTHWGGRLTQWPLYALWCYHWTAWCVQGEYWRIYPLLLSLYPSFIISCPDIHRHQAWTSLLLLLINLILIYTRKSIPTSFHVLHVCFCCFAVWSMFREEYHIMSALIF